MSPSMKGYAICIFLFMIIRGTTFFELPSLVTRAFGTNSWIMLGVFTAVIIVQLWLLSKGAAKHQNQSVLQVIAYRFPAWLGKTLLLLLSIFYTCTAFRVTFSFIRVLQFTNDPSLKIRTVSILMLIMVAVIAYHGIYTMTKSTLVFFGLSIWIVLFGLLQFKDFNLIRLSPFIFRGGSWRFADILDVYSSFQGYLIILYMTPYIDRTIKWFKYAALAMLLIGGYYMLNCMLTQGLVPYEMLMNVRHVALRVNGASRVTALVYITDLLFITFVFSSIMTSAVLLWSAFQSMQLVTVKKIKTAKLVIVLASLMLVYIPLNYDRWNQFFRLLAFIGLVLSFFYILLYFLFPYKPIPSQSGDTGTGTQEATNLGSLPVMEGGQQA